MSDQRVRFEPVARRTVAEEIRQRLQTSILDGDLAPGSRMPSERALCDDFGVARTSVREAIQGLVSMGLIERRGNRAYVVEHLPTLSVGTGEADDRKEFVSRLFETRRVIELPIGELAACRATDEERADVAAQAAAFHPNMTLEEFRAADRRFHWTIASACHNHLLAEVYGKVLDALFQSPEFSSLLGAQPNQDVVARIIADSCDAHVAISDALTAGDPVQIVAAIEHHLAEVEGRMIAQLQ